jgi:hypothetical protein
MLNGYPISAKLPEDLGFGERFWYWRGHSGQSYIHSIYASDACPPLPGAVYVAVRRSQGHRQPLKVGRFPVSIDGAKLDLSALLPWLRPEDELHVHLLARDSETADRVERDLDNALQGPPAAIECMPGFAETNQAILLAA